MAWAVVVVVVVVGPVFPAPGSPSPFLQRTGRHPDRTPCPSLTPHPPPGPGSLPHPPQPGVAGRLRGTSVGRGEQSTRLFYAGVIECYLPMVFFYCTFSFQLRWAQGNAGRREQRRARTCFTPSKKFNSLMSYYYYYYYYYFSMGGLRGGNASTREHEIKGEQGHSLILLRVINLFSGKDML